MHQPPSLTVIIPTYNEAAVIAATVGEVLSRARPKPDVLVVDGGSSDRTAALAARAGARVLTVSGGRAAQLNAGAAAAASDTLMFLHADSTPPPNYNVTVHSVLRGRGVALSAPRGAGVAQQRRAVVAGAFRLRVDGRGWPLRFVEAVVNWRSTRLGLPYGDQGLFLRRAAFDAAGGYPDMPFLEDYEMSRRLSRAGTLAIADEAVVTSARRWQTLGVWRTSAINQCVVFGYHLGVPVTTLAYWYRGTLRRAVERQRKLAAEAASVSAASK